MKGIKILKEEVNVFLVIGKLIVNVEHPMNTK